MTPFATFGKEDTVAKKSLANHLDDLCATLGFGKGPGRGGSSNRFKIFGKSVSSVLRWMAAKGWDFEDAKKAIRAAGCEDVTDITIRCQLALDDAGRPVRGKPARLTKEQAAALAEAC